MTRTCVVASEREMPYFLINAYICMYTLMRVCVCARVIFISFWCDFGSSLCFLLRSKRKQSIKLFSSLLCIFAIAIVVVLAVVIAWYVTTTAQQLKCSFFNSCYIADTAATTPYLIRCSLFFTLRRCKYVECI